MTPVDKIFRIALSIFLIWNTTPVYADHDGSEGTHLPDPSTANVTEGAASVAKEGNKMTVVTETERTIIEWLRGLGVAENEILEFLQPSSSSAVLNRIFSGSPSYILGQILSNGQVFLINTSGIIFGRDSSVNVGGLIASALDIADEDFLSGNYHFSRPEGVNPAMVINEGDIRAAEGGPVALIGGAVKNSGTIDAYLGNIALASGDQVTVSFTPDQLISVAVDEGTSQEVLDQNGEAVTSLVENSGTLRADGGKVSLSTKQVLDIFDQAVNHQGIIEARSVGVKDGVVEFLGEGGTVVVDGTITAGGTVDIEGEGVLGDGLITGETVKLEASDDIMAKTSSETLIVSNVNGDITIEESDNVTVGSISAEGDITITGAGSVTIEVDSTITSGGTVTIIAAGNGSIDESDSSLSPDGGSTIVVSDSSNNNESVVAETETLKIEEADQQVDLVEGGTVEVVNVAENNEESTSQAVGSTITVESKIEKKEETAKEEGMAELVKNIPAQNSFTENILIPQAEIAGPVQETGVVALDSSLNQDSQTALAYNSQDLSLDD